MKKLFLTLLLFCGTMLAAGGERLFDLFQNVLIIRDIIIDAAADESGSGKLLAVGGDDDNGRVPGNRVFLCEAGFRNIVFL